MVATIDMNKTKLLSMIHKIGMFNNYEYELKDSFKLNTY